MSLITIIMNLDFQKSTPTSQKFSWTFRSPLQPAKSFHGLSEVHSNETKVFMDFQKSSPTRQKFSWTFESPLQPDKSFHGLLKVLPNQTKVFMDFQYKLTKIQAIYSRWLVIEIKA